MIIFHIIDDYGCTIDMDLNSYINNNLKKDGCIHCCTFDQILYVANNVLKSENSFMKIICINIHYLQSKVIWKETSNNMMSFPHILGYINSESIINVLTLSRNEKEQFFISNELYNYQKYEKSCGAVIIHKFGDVYKILLIKFFHDGAERWGFPKGHVEKGEDEHQTAEREVMEEVGLKIKFIDGFRKNTYFSYIKGITLEAVYYGAISNSDEVKCQKGEIDGFLWCDFSDVGKYLTYDCDKNIFYSFSNFFKEHPIE